MGSGAFIAADQAPEPGDPFQAALDDVAVPAEPGRGLDALARDPRGDVAAAEQVAAFGIVVALVAVQFARPFPWAPDRPADRLDAVDHVLEQAVVVEVGGRDVHVQWQATALCDGVDLAAGLAPVYRAWPGQVPLLSARTCMLSILARDQSI